MRNRAQILLNSTRKKEKPVNTNAAIISKKQCLLVHLYKLRFNGFKYKCLPNIIKTYERVQGYGVNKLLSTDRLSPGRALYPMLVCVCAYILMYVCTCVCVCARMHACVRTYVCVSIWCGYIWTTTRDLGTWAKSALKTVYVLLERMCVGAGDSIFVSGVVL